MAGLTVNTATGANPHLPPLWPPLWPRLWRPQELAPKVQAPGTSQRASSVVTGMGLAVSPSLAGSNGENGMANSRSEAVQANATGGSTVLYSEHPNVQAARHSVSDSQMAQLLQQAQLTAQRAAVQATLPIEA